MGRPWAGLKVVKDHKTARSMGLANHLDMYPCTYRVDVNHTSVRRHIHAVLVSVGSWRVRQVPVSTMCSLEVFMLYIDIRLFYGEARSLSTIESHAWFAIEVGWLVLPLPNNSTKSSEHSNELASIFQSRSRLCKVFSHEKRQYTIKGDHNLLICLICSGKFEEVQI